MESVLVPEVMAGLGLNFDRTESDQKPNKAAQKTAREAMKAMTDNLYEGANEAFFITKDAKKDRKVGVLALNVELWNIASLLNMAQELPRSKAHNYFNVKARLSSGLGDAYDSLRGLELTKDTPTFTLESKDGSSGSISISDYLGKEAKTKLTLTTVHLISDHKERIDITS